MNTYSVKLNCSSIEVYGKSLQEAITQHWDMVCGLIPRSVEKMTIKKMIVLPSTIKYETPYSTSRENPIPNTPRIGFEQKIALTVERVSEVLPTKGKTLQTDHTLHISGKTGEIVVSEATAFLDETGIIDRVFTMAI